MPYLYAEPNRWLSNKKFVDLSPSKKSLLNFSFIRVLRIPCSINAESFIKIGDHVGTSWLRSPGTTLIQFYISDTW